MGAVDVTVTYKGQSHKVPLIVVKGSGLTLMGRNWLQLFKLDWQEIFLLQSNSLSPIQQILQKHSNVFQEGLGTLTGFKLSFGSKWTNRRDDVSSSLEAENALVCSVVHCHLVDFCSNLSLRSL